MSEGGLEPPRPTRALAPQASASAIPPLGQRAADRARIADASGRPPRHRIAGGRKIRMTSAGRPRTRSSSCAPSSSGSTPPTPASPTRRRGSGRRPTTSPRSSPRSGSSTSWSSRARRGATTCSAGSPGPIPRRGALLVHGHLDVVPADASEWSVHPFSGAVQDGYVWGRGAVDMKDMVAMTLAVARAFKRDGVVPAARHRVRVPRRRGGGRRVRRAVAGARTGRTCSRGAPRRSGRSAASR